MTYRCKCAANSEMCWKHINGADSRIYKRNNNCNRKNATKTEPCNCIDCETRKVKILQTPKRRKKKKEAYLSQVGQVRFHWSVIKTLDQSEYLRL